jgi:hypothetical protein
MMLVPTRALNWAANSGLRNLRAASSISCREYQLTYWSFCPLSIGAAALASGSSLPRLASLVRNETDLWLHASYQDACTKAEDEVKVSDGMARCDVV